MKITNSPISEPFHVTCIFIRKEESSTCQFNSHDLDITSLSFRPSNVGTIRRYIVIKRLSFTRITILDNNNSILLYKKIAR